MLLDSQGQEKSPKSNKYGGKILFGVGTFYFSILHYSCSSSKDLVLSGLLHHLRCSIADVTSTRENSCQQQGHTTLTSSLGAFPSFGWGRVM